jgi:hypothetical protein
MDEESSSSPIGHTNQEENTSFDTDVSFSSSTTSLSHQHTFLPNFNLLLQPTVVIPPPSQHNQDLYNAISSINSNQAHLTQVLDKLSSKVDRFAPSSEGQSQY